MVPVPVVLSMMDRLARWVDRHPVVAGLLMVVFCVLSGLVVRWCSGWLWILRLIRGCHGQVCEVPI